VGVTDIITGNVNRHISLFNVRFKLSDVSFRKAISRKDASIPLILTTDAQTKSVTIDANAWQCKKYITSHRSALTAKQRLNLLVRYSHGVFPLSCFPILPSADSLDLRSPSDESGSSKGDLISLFRSMKALKTQESLSR
jgi:hypothetical protein